MKPGAATQAQGSQNRRAPPGAGHLPEEALGGAPETPGARTWSPQVTPNVLGGALEEASHADRRPGDPPSRTKRRGGSGGRETPNIEGSVQPGQHEGAQERQQCGEQCGAPQKRPAGEGS